MSSARAAYRMHQFLTALGVCLGAGRARPSPQERQMIATRLSPGQQRLFYAMAARDQRHCLDVFHALEGRGCADEELLLAALLHDVGKGPVRLWQRVAYVLLAAISPRLLNWLAAPGAGGQGALASLRHHASAGAALAEAAGTPAAVVELIRRHEMADPDDRRLALLRAADESC